MFLHTTKYTLDREELQAYLNGSIYDYADNEIVAEDNELAADLLHESLVLLPALKELPLYGRPLGFVGHYGDKYGRPPHVLGVQGHLEGKGPAVTAAASDPAG